ncbi:hypothetical protein LTR99_009784 [Exophiala xenobiotica]|uniref:ABM domain-containing protein n=1 Tax=Vermiconidia calcicola TaxID=1690605 RepID=A0AAV9PWS9_9PEZI|nr:hypothetical protein LTR92_007638 [Exophiala xenobiotica]KAK5529355.1 hypothetical protein LTR23_010697 [Chaetothyriales sp. CCFEE 6169]KAK5530622.1 hypothetical protein LTR25_009200 [Vermiconidia calcicola]KAK5267761.1 hypothetical protein LTR96_007089 [Exophiala xenobiotica]KAK5294386.1 hypothetical protein LTR99_009784 [Exophiala xenobiotica]
MGVTEIAFLPLQEGKFPDDRTSVPGQVHVDVLDILLSQPGCQRCYWGRQVEDRNLLRWFVDWDNIDSHKKFMNSALYKPFLDRFRLILGGPTNLYHAQFTPHPPTAALSDTTSPTTEIVTMWFPTSYSEEDKKKVVDDAKALVAVVEKEAKTYRASAGGWVEEDIDIPGTDEKGKAYVLLIGWTSVEAHMEFRETNAFKENIHYLRDAKDLKKLEAVHASMTEVTGGAAGVGDVSDVQPDIQGEVLNPQSGSKNPPKTKSDGTTTKHAEQLRGAANAFHKPATGS